MALRDDQLLFEKSYGSAVEEWKLPDPPERKYEVASLSKQFTAVAILQLADEGKLSVQDHVSKYYPQSPQKLERHDDSSFANAYFRSTGERLGRFLQTQVRVLHD